MDLAALIGPDISLPGKHRHADILGLTADSRKVRPGWLFVALPGSRANGLDYVGEALARGAAAILAPCGGPGTLPGADVAADVACIADRNPRRRLALMAARFFRAQPDSIAAITGTNGKTSVAVFAQRLWTLLGESSASLGTLGLSAAPAAPAAGGLTTPDPVGLHRMLAELAASGVTRLAMEASSHGLGQHRMDAVRITAAAFTNLSRDHMDYHGGGDDYAYAKLRLFGEVLPPGGAAVINADAPFAAWVEAVSRARGHRIITTGRSVRDGDGIRLEALHPLGLDGQRLELRHDGASCVVTLPLPGAFQAANALVAAGLVIASGAPPPAVFAALEHLRGIPGRLEHIGRTRTGAPVFVDYAHTPDALAHALRALRDHAAGRLVLVFGCGGDRDRGKRAAMGRIAAAHAARVIITDDNPRTEDPAAIRAQVALACPGAENIADRAQAIAAAIAGLDAEDVLLVAGKGHETGQIMAAEVRDFSDRETVLNIIGEDAS